MPLLASHAVRLEGVVIIMAMTTTSYTTKLMRIIIIIALLLETKTCAVVHNNPGLFDYGRT